MAFVLTSLYVAISLLSPAVLPVAIYSLHVNIVLGVLAIIACTVQFGGSKLGRLPETYLVAGLLGAAMLSIAATGWLGAVPAVLVDYTPIFIVYYFIVLGCRSIGQLKVLTYVMLFVAFYIFASGAIAEYTGNLTSPYLTPEGAVYRYRGLGVLSDPNDTAQFFVTLIPLLFLRWQKGKHLLNLLLTIVPACILLTGMFFTHSRGGVVALVAVILFGFKDRLGVVKSSVLAAALFGGMMVLDVSGGRGMNEDDGGRIAAWGTGLEIFRSHPIFGVGIDHFNEYNDTGHTAHNSYVLCLSEIGLIGYACWMGAIVSGWTGLTLLTRRDAGYEGAGEQSTANPFARSRLSGGVLAPVMHGSPVEPRRQSFVAQTMRSGAMAAPQGFAPMTYQETSPAVLLAPLSMRSALASPEPESDEALARAAKAFRTSFVGLLTAAFFLSRTFSMLFYILIGMMAVLRLLYRERHPEVKTAYLALASKIGLVLAGSVIFLYLFVRIRGVH